MLPDYSDFNPLKGAIREGSDADIMVFDPEKRVRIDHKALNTCCDWSPYEGFRLSAWPILTISRGEIIAKDGIFLARAGRGRFVPRGPSPSPN